MGVKHRRTASHADGPDDGRVLPSWWNDDHDIGDFLSAIFGLAVTARTLPYIKADGTAGLVNLSDFVRSVLASADGAALLAAIGGAALASPALSGTPTAPTAALNTSTTQIATMAALQQMRADMIATAPATLDTFNEIANALGNDPNFAATMLAALGNRLRFDAAQTLTVGQKAQALVNLGVALGTAAALDVGTAANKIVQLDASARLPSVDGSLLQNVVAAGSLSFVSAQTMTAANKERLRQNASALSSGGGFSNLAAQRGSASPNNLWAVTWDALELFDANGASVTYRSASASIDTNVIGAGGLSTAKAAGYGYYIWAWVDPNGALCLTGDLSSTAPTAPAGYTYKRRIGYIILDGSGNIINLRQRGRRSSYVSPRTVASGTSAYQSWPITSFVPATAAIFFGVMTQNNNSVTVGDSDGNQICGLTVGSSGACYLPFEFLIGPSVLYFGSSSGGGAVSCVGWEDNF